MKLIWELDMICKCWINDIYGVLHSVYYFYYWLLLLLLLCISWASQMKLVLKKSPTNAGDIRDMSSSPGLGRSPGGWHGNPLQYSCLENPMDREGWQATVHGVAESWTWLTLSLLSLWFSVVAEVLFVLKGWYRKGEIFIAYGIMIVKWTFFYPSYGMHWHYIKLYQVLSHSTSLF